MLETCSILLSVSAGHTDKIRQNFGSSGNFFIPVKHIVLYMYMKYTKNSASLPDLHVLSDKCQHTDDISELDKYDSTVATRDKLIHDHKDS